MCWKWRTRTRLHESCGRDQSEQRSVTTTQQILWTSGSVNHLHHGRPPSARSPSSSSYSTQSQPLSPRAPINCLTFSNSSMIILSQIVNRIHNDEGGAESHRRQWAFGWASPQRGWDYPPNFLLNLPLPIFIAASNRADCDIGTLANNLPPSRGKS